MKFSVCSKVNEIGDLSLGEIYENDEAESCGSAPFYYLLQKCF